MGWLLIRWRRFRTGGGSERFIDDDCCINNGHSGFSDVINIDDDGTDAADICASRDHNPRWPGFGGRRVRQLWQCDIDLRGAKDLE